MSEENRSFWDRLFGSTEENEQERKVREYMIENIIKDPRLIEAAQEQMREDFSSGRLDPEPPPSAAR